MRLQQTLAYEYEKENIAYWTNRAPGYSEVNRQELRSGQRGVWGRTLAEAIADHYPGRKRQDIAVLDIGTGPGFFAIILAEMGFAVTAVDYTDSMLDKARANAGKWRDQICFRKMNAEELTFAPESFDVIVSRNLTWNLHDPKKAYQSWERVLKSGGLLLNFDANWYRYLYHADALKAHLTDRENVEKTHAADDTAGTDVAAMEAIAKKAPLSQTLRPAWDLTLLSSLGMDANADETIWRQVWTKEEWINNASTPLFLVYSTKRSARPAGRV